MLGEEEACFDDHQSPLPHLSTGQVEDERPEVQYPARTIQAIVNTAEDEYGTLSGAIYIKINKYKTNIIFLINNTIMELYILMMLGYMSAELLALSQYCTGSKNHENGNVIIE